MTRLDQLLRDTPYASYTYAYPHKTAYRPLDPPIPLRDLWAGERRESLFLYLHIPFCEMRCGFCNLFTTTNPKGDFEAAYLDALQRQAGRVRAALGPAKFARLAIGGGTPTYLSPAGLHTLFDIAGRIFSVDPAIPVSVETSPHTATPEKLRVLRERGAGRISIGVQSFIEAEVHAAGRAQTRAAVEQALTYIRAAGFPTLNIDLIYGLPGQTVASWLDSLRAALRFAPEELYLYPLYIRPLTGLGVRADIQLNGGGQTGVQSNEGGRGVQLNAPTAPIDAAEDIRLACYRAGRELLHDAGYTQVSMRMFRAPHAPALDGPVYCCQEDGMVGLGCGARSYTHALHYSSEYAVGARGVRAILNDYVKKDDAAFDHADYGFALDPDEQRRRYIIQSLLQADGLAFSPYRARFGCDALDDLPDLAELVEHGLARQSAGLLQLTEAGLERSDTIGPWLYSARVRQLMEAYELQ